KTFFRCVFSFWHPSTRLHRTALSVTQRIDVDNHHRISLLPIRYPLWGDRPLSKQMASCFSYIRAARCDGGPITPPAARTVALDDRTGRIQPLAFSRHILRWKLILSLQKFDTLQREICPGGCSCITYFSISIDCRRIGLRHTRRLSHFLDCATF